MDSKNKLSIGESMKYLLNIIVLMSVGWAACPDGYYEDDCGTCWMPYCYEYATNSVSYDLEESECSSDSSAWVIPGSQGDPFFNNYCDGSCPDNFLADDCDHCWSGFCYSFFENGLNGDPPHSVYYDLSIQECEGYGYNYYAPDNVANPDWNSNCTSDCTGNPGGDAVEDCAGICDGDAMIDDCSDCQQSYCYDYVTNAVNFDAEYACDGETEMFVEADSPSNPYWNAGCDIEEDACDTCLEGCVAYVMDNYGYTEEQGTEWCLSTPDSSYGCADTCDDGTGEEDCNGTIDGDAMIDDCGDCQQSYCYDYVTNAVNFDTDYACDGDTEMFVEADSPSNPYWNGSKDECGVCDGPGYSFTGNANEDCELNILDIVAMVQIIINGAEYNYDADMTGDGIINI
ncbi:hypothetical protein N9471_00220, partial [bacterium]|nr:hypothetical protein [bacterium]